MLDFGLRSIIFIVLCIIVFISKNYRGILYYKVKCFIGKYSQSSLPKNKGDDSGDLFPPSSPEQTAANEAVDNMTMGELCGDDAEIDETIAYDVHEIETPRVLRKKRKLIPADLKSGIIGACCGLVLDRVVKLLEHYVPLFIDKFME